jgi:hypothetical protein
MDDVEIRIKCLEFAVDKSYVFDYDDDFGAQALDAAERFYNFVTSNEIEE